MLLDVTEFGLVSPKSPVSEWRSIAFAITLDQAYSPVSLGRQLRVAGMRLKKARIS